MKCPKCNKDKEEAQFPKRRGKGVVERPRQCNDCKKDKFNETHPDHWKTTRDPEQHRQTQKKYAQSSRGKTTRQALHYKKTYGIELEEAILQKALQKNLCAICKRESADHLDHNHETGKPRGFLCHGCNVGIGLLKEDITILEDAIKYLQSNGIWERSVNG